MASEAFATDVLKLLDLILSRQKYDLYLVIAFYLDQAVITAIRDHLGPINYYLDDPDIDGPELPEGVVGQYRTIPVYPKEILPHPGAPCRTVENVDYIYIPLLSAD